MDVRRWLENTADRAPPDQREHEGIADFLRPHAEPVPEDRGPKYRRKRKRASSDSSLIQPRHLDHVRQPPAEHDRRPASDVQVAARPATSLHGSPSARSREAERPAKTYERRARHKTRPDRYEPKPKKPGKEREKRTTVKRSEPRRARKGGDGERTTGLVQSFQTKNRPKSSRLTLRPDANAGVFKHGRASAQVIGRGVGLPDLVFNEMRFLQKPHEHQDAPQGDHEQTSAPKQDRQHRREEEISAYFAAKKAGSPKSTSKQLQDPPGRNDGHHSSTPRKTTRDKGRDVASPPVELPDKPFLGFGSRGDRHVSKSDHLEGHSYYTWSESEPIEAKAVNPRTLKVPLLEAGQLSASGKREATATRSKRDIHAPAHDRPNEVERLDQDKIELHQVRRPRHVEVPSKEAIRHRRSITKTTAQSLPRDSSLERRFASLRQLDHDSVQQGDNEHHTSDILRVRPLKHTAACKPSPRACDAMNESPVGKENADPMSSTPTGKLLRQAQTALRSPRVATADPPQTHAHHQAHMQQSQTREHGKALRQRRLTPATDSRPEPTHADERLLQTQARLHPDLGIRQPSALVNHEDIDVLNDGYAGPPMPFDHGFVYADPRQAEDLVYGAYSNQAPEVYEVCEPWAFADDEEAVPAPDSEEALLQTLSVRGRSPVAHQAFDDDFPAAAGLGGEDEADDRLTGFWKPNKLY